MTEALRIEKPLPVGSAGRKSPGWWGVWTLIATEASLFGYLLLSYFYLYFQADRHWPPEGHPKLMMPGINTAILLSSSVFVWIAERGVRRGRGRGWSCMLLLIAVSLGVAFVFIQLGEWHGKSYGPRTNLYGSLYFIITGFHLAHVVVGLVILSLMTLWTGLGYFNARRMAPVTLGGLYWHFVDAVWIFIFSTFYLLPYLPVT